jgi:phage shock protein PspC (stress-responsive transcriptional regulator)
MQLRRSHADHRIAGVCGGLAANLGWDSGKLRIVWVLATIFTAFAGVVVCLALWYLMPEEPPAPLSFDPPPLQPWKRTV